jgi:5-dehydro-2-deoxygluconokinase
MTTSSPLDLITIGRSSVDLYGQQIGGRLESMVSFAKYVGGSPTNTAIGGARLGLKTGVITRVGADHMGRFIHEELEHEGVAIDGVKFDAERLTALVVLGIRDAGTFPLIFYRENCADMALTADDIDAEFVRSAAAVLVNGTHLSQPGVFAASFRAIEIARQAGRKVVFDIDYRPVLWGLEARDGGENRFVAHAGVTEQMQRVSKFCDLIVGTEEEVHVLGGSADTLTALRNIRAQTSALIILKLGARGCLAVPKAIPKTIEQSMFAEGFSVDVLNVLGAGDAFISGFLRGWLRGMPLERCCTLGNAAGAIVVSRHGCAPAMPTWRELEHFLLMRSRPHRLREDAQLEHVHWATTRRGVYDELTVLAIDHRAQFEDLARTHNVSVEQIGSFKLLALRAVDHLANKNPKYGILLDGRHGVRALEAAADLPYWTGRPIEVPQSCPLEFECGPDVGAEIAQWPQNQVVKVLVLYHPDDAQDLRERQERQVLRLFDACRKTGHELLIEIIASKNGLVDSETIAWVMQRFYDLEVRPDWWKLEPSSDRVAWRNIERVILANDSLCRGVLLLGLSIAKEELVQYFAPAASVNIVKGFAVGRTIFFNTAERWFKGEINDQGVVNQLALEFSGLVDAWRMARKMEIEHK